MEVINQIKSFMAKKIYGIQNDSSDSAARAELANLRRGIGHRPGELPELWGSYLLGLPEELLGRFGKASRAEWAVYTTLTLYALHQQGKDRKSESMHCPGISLGAAANRLVANEENDRERIARRFYPAATATDMEEMSHHLRGLITLFRANSIPLDYVQLAADLYCFQYPEMADKVRLRWGEDFCRIKFNEESEEKGN